MKCDWKHRVFWDVYERAGMCSELSGTPVSRPRNWNFAHILPKSEYPELMYDPENIMFVTYNEHHLIDHGSHEQRQKSGIDFEPFFRRRKELAWELYKKTNE